jgi:hypothetical protein
MILGNYTNGLYQEDADNSSREASLSSHHTKEALILEVWNFFYFISLHAEWLA